MKVTLEDVALEGSGENSIHSAEETFEIVQLSTGVDPKKLPKNYTHGMVQTVGNIINEALIELNRYNENQEEVVSFPEWLERKRNNWILTKHCSSRFSKACFKVMLEQGIVSLASALDKVDQETVKTEAEEKNFDILPTVNKLHYYWAEEHECAKWLNTLCSQLDKSAYEKHYVSELSERLVDEAMLPYLRIAKSLGLNLEDAGKFKILSLTRRRFPDDRPSAERFVTIVLDQV